MQKGVVDFITLGCSKNLVDAERVMRQLEAAGWRCVHDAEEPRGEICVINTCGFIGDAKEESINMILRMAERKKEGKLRKLIVMGCLSTRYKPQLEEEMPEVDRFIAIEEYGHLFFIKAFAEDLAADLVIVRFAPGEEGDILFSHPEKEAAERIFNGRRRADIFFGYSCQVPDEVIDLSVLRAYVG